MYPREIVDKALRLHSQGWTDRAVAQACGVSIQSVRHWRKGRRRNGRIDAASYCPICGDGELAEEAYVYLLGLYLGDGYISPSGRANYLSIVCGDVWPGLMDLCHASMARVLPTSVFRVQRIGCTEVKSTSKHWPCLFPQHGPGAKHTRAIALVPWQTEIVGRHPEGFVRGLLHSDGCRITNRVKRTVAGKDKWYEYPRYFFSNNSRDIHGLLGRYLDQLGIEWRMSNANNLSIAKRDSVARLDTFVGPKR
ncbi:hypothetical protein F4561_001858 [Lipingzhangella halophila]|uniref:DOD-type homing endonuclease domain-containing protein n=1 Tax=Lipingzhangella halophila TaxID=1783352 RepID=A0A7W7RFG0_9ACTN|nr:helix-turn-helix domain-containing protein [Lipingzhangella halophila]MBB4931038.1 hypothetical protein [Lipingzhangella halophila]